MSAFPLAEWLTGVGIGVLILAGGPILEAACSALGWVIYGVDCALRALVRAPRRFAARWLA